MDITPWTTGNFPKHKHEGKNPDVEEVLNQRLFILTGRGVHVSGSMLKSKSEDS
jgi:hypothetical protein